MKSGKVWEVRYVLFFGLEYAIVKLGSSKFIYWRDKLNNCWSAVCSAERKDEIMSKTADKKEIDLEQSNLPEFFPADLSTQTLRYELRLAKDPELIDFINKILLFIYEAQGIAGVSS